MTKKNKILTGLALSILLVLFFLPTLVKNYIVGHGKELTGRKIAIGQFNYNYLSSTAKVYDFKMYESNDIDAFSTLDTLIVNLEPLKLLSNTLEIEQLYMRGLMTKIIMKDSIFNFDDLVAFYAQPKDTLITEAA